MMNRLASRLGQRCRTAPVRPAPLRTGAMVAAAALALTGLVASPAAAVQVPPAASAAATVAPDEWHCAWANNADDVCIHMNQFLGWWTGFEVQYRYRGFTWFPVTVQLSFRMQRRNPATGTWDVVRAETWPESRSMNGAAQNFSKDTWADLPTGTCVTGIARVRGDYVGAAPTRNYEVTVCR